MFRRVSLCVPQATPVIERDVFVHRLLSSVDELLNDADKIENIVRSVLMFCIESMCNEYVYLSVRLQTTAAEVWCGIGSSLRHVPPSAHPTWRGKLPVSSA